ncbi:Acetyltransferase (GNAT) domain-containing protein [Ligilactobacillus sp. WC1T17]|uniref:Acetyltransferase (GNAT) domain-containing protein n=1 Tax=Ligilactobacillus ruminis TaxID=1623 RepID=A0ABY1ACV5_9LACO|nr:Acetyltransferase (GNAT) domain-containing protein [Ligilactobacillus ruminis]
MELIVNPKLNRNDILRLYQKCGLELNVSGLEHLRKGLKKSYVLAAYEEGRLIGLVRALSDYATLVYVKDLLILPEYQNQRVAKNLMQHLLDYFGTVEQVVVAIKNDNGSLDEFLRYLNFRESDAKVYLIDRR